MPDWSEKFWDLSEHLEKSSSRKPNNPALSAKLPDTSAPVEIDLPGRTGGDGAEISGDVLRLSFKESCPVNSKILYVYHPDSPLFGNVTVSSRRSPYCFYDHFISFGRKNIGAVSEECAYQPFFSYIPQYSSMNHNQLNYFYFLRDSVRHGSFPKADMSYLLLMLYEIINFPDLIEPYDGLATMSDIWLNYRNSFPELDKYLCEWMCDFCLIHRLLPDRDKLRPILGRIIKKASIKELFLAGISDGHSDKNSIISSALIDLTSAYNWRDSKILTEENADLFSKHMAGALSYVSDHSELRNVSPVLTLKSRDAYTASLPSQNVRLHLDIEYYSFSESIELKALVTAVVKNTENRIRSFLGMRKKLNAPQLPEKIRSVLYEYLDSELPLSDTKKPRVSGGIATPVQDAEYLKKYEPVHTGFDIKLSEEIEKSSWEMAVMLDRQSEEYAFPAEKENYIAEKSYTGILPSRNSTVQDPDEPVQENEFAVIVSALSEEETNFLKDILSGKQDLRGIDADNKASSINDKAVSALGDILLEETDKGYSVIEEYREAVSGFFPHPGS